VSARKPYASDLSDERWALIESVITAWKVAHEAGRSEDPSPAVLDTQSVHAPVNVPAATTGRDAAAPAANWPRAEPLWVAR
jgi:hypothetical protein